MQRGWLRVMVRYRLVVLMEQGRPTQEEAAQEMGLSVRPFDMSPRPVRRPRNERRHGEQAQDHKSKMSHRFPSLRLSTRRRLGRRKESVAFS